MRAEIWFPGAWPSLNDLKDAAGYGGGKAGNGWNKLKQKWQEGARWQIRAMRPKVPAFTAPVKIHYLHVRPNRRGDGSNYAAAAMKIIEDALVAEGVIPNDTFAWVAGFSHEFRFVGAPGVRVTIELAALAGTDQVA